ncbi:MAG: Gfo/Idh/MocA family oxidoreductase [Anaerolineae bacterium]
MSRPVEMVLLGAGNRGTFAYGRYARRNPHRARFVAVAEPDERRRQRFAQEHEIPPEGRFASWQELMERPRMAEALVNATMDRMHYDSTLAALENGYDVLLEKPIAATAEECVGLVRAAIDADRILQVCHVLRYTQFWRTLYDIVTSGELGRVVSVDQRENVAYWHMAHSYVRGNWRRADTSSPMILAKCCHDMDILYWILGQKVRSLSSFGSLTVFQPEHAPEGAPPRCTDGCPAQEECPYYAPRLYLGRDAGWPANVISLDQSVEARLEALREGPYGRCVYRCDNDVVDHQVVDMELENDTTITFTMHGHSHDNVRTMRYDGTRATLRATGASNEIAVYDHLTSGEKVVRPGEAQGGHGGGDTGVMNAFVAALRGPDYSAPTSARESLESHLMAFAAERARLTGQIIDMAAYRKELGAVDPLDV